MANFLSSVAKTKNWTTIQWYDPSRSGLYGEMWPIENATYNKNTIHVGHRPPQRLIPEARLEQCFIFTVLREPIDRVVSLFNYRMNKDWDTCLFEDESITSVCNNTGEHRDWMVKLLSMGSPKVCGPRAERNCNIDKDTGLQISKNLLLDYDLVCFQDDLDGCIEKLHQFLDFEHNQVPQEAPKKNINKNRGSSESKITLKKIELVNQYDIELYKWAVSQFRS